MQKVSNLRIPARDVVASHLYPVLNCLDLIITIVEQMGYLVLIMQSISVLES